MASLIINDAKRENIEEESARIVMAAVKIIKAQVNVISCNMDSYPTNHNISGINDAYQ